MLRLQLSLDDTLVKQLKDTVKEAKNTHGIKTNVAELTRQLLLDALNDSYALDKSLQNLKDNKNSQKEAEEAYQKELKALQEKYGIASKTKKKKSTKETSESFNKQVEEATPKADTNTRRASKYQLPDGRTVDVWKADKTTSWCQIGDHVYKETDGKYYKLPDGSFKVEQLRHKEY